MGDISFSVADAAKATNCATKDCALGGEIDMGELRVTVTKYSTDGKKHLSHSHAICFLTKTAPRARYPFSLDDLSGLDELSDDVQALLQGYMVSGGLFFCWDPPREKISRACLFFPHPERARMRRRGRRRR